MQPLLINDLTLPKLLQLANTLNPSGHLVVTPSKLVCLDIDDAYIHQLFPLLKIANAVKPNYFNEGGIGAHISVIYPEEQVVLDSQDIGTEHSFKVTGIFSTVIEQKKYYALKVQATTLLDIRKHYRLSKQLNFKNYGIDLHITIAVAIRLHCEE